MNVVVRIRFNQARRELLKRRVRLDRRLLDEILRVGRVPRHPERSGIQLAKLRNNIALKTLAILARVFGSAHVRSG
jgi:hypothetical protein